MSHCRQWNVCWEVPTPGVKGLRAIKAIISLKFFCVTLGLFSPPNVLVIEKVKTKFRLYGVGSTDE